MSFLDLPEKEQLDGAALELTEDAEKRWGYTPNIVRAYSLAPQIMEAEDVWTKGVMHTGLLPRRLKEGIATVVSATNNCNYCSSSHAVAYTIAGGDDEEAKACKLLNLDGFDEPERQALQFARKAVNDPKSITQQDINNLKEHYSQPEIVEIAVVIQQFMGYNWFVTILGLELEEGNFMADV